LYAAHSVHFEGDDDQAAAAAASSATTTEIDNGGAKDSQSFALKTNDSSAVDIVTFPDEMDSVNSKQKRNLDQWCFAEHMDTRVLIQVRKLGTRELSRVHNNGDRIVEQYALEE
jgi:hypothetical protein